ncbi:hypothetical protein AB0D38_31555 [Streptomyces sp. NPDC048279]|uniref:hypothetical protein n=1 Tax=Streptomyces sp. NPDC048279 TaxID=3154714 RepID=UPI00342A13ED
MLGHAPSVVRRKTRTATPRPGHSERTDWSDWREGRRADAHLLPVADTALDTMATLSADGSRGAATIGRPV